MEPAGGAERAACSLPTPTMVCDGSASNPATGCRETKEYNALPDSSVTAVTKNWVYGTFLEFLFPVEPFTTIDRSCCDACTQKTVVDTKKMRMHGESNGIAGGIRQQVQCGGLWWRRHRK